MDLDRRQTLALLGAATTGAAKAAVPGGRRATGPFTPEWASLTHGYRAPEWFRDAKFGIWAHWSAQCVPEAGDWYAREMYRQGSPIYKKHLAKYGHPTGFGFMEIDNLWKAERWEPEALIDLYTRAGAKYFVALANHHDNFDAYDSQYHAWNSMRVGPKRDIVGTWAKLARARGLRFGVSNHSAHAWHWLQTAYGYDPEGPRQGQRYDAARLTPAMGKGKWWEGLDPQELYAGRTSLALPDGIPSMLEANAVGERTNLVWNEGIPRENPNFARSWFLRCRDLIDKYQPDLLYFDNSNLPMEHYGLEIAAHYYNASVARAGRADVVINAKNMPAAIRMGLVEDVERGGKGSIEIYPWQTDTCIGNWHYDRALYDRNGYKTAATVIHTLCDVMSKNGNLLLNVPVRGDGTIDEKERAIVEEIATWMGRYGSAIHGTRPWRYHAEGPTKPNSGSFNEGGPDSPYTAADIRYARRGNDVHAFVLGWPADGVARLTLLGADNPVGRGQIARITVPGSDAPLAFERRGDALLVTLPEALRNRIGIALIVQGSNLTQGSLVEA